MDYDVLKAFIELFHYPICDVRIADGCLSFSIKTAAFDLSSLDGFNCLLLSFPDRKDFIYYPNIYLSYENGSRVIRVYYEVEKVEQFISLRQNKYK